MPRRRRETHRPLAIAGSHWRADGRPKVAYPTQKEALDAAEERGRESGTPLGTYRCDFCGGWHMGRRTGREQD